MKTKLGQAVPADLASAVGRSSKTTEMWGALRPSCQKRFAEHVTEAKRPETRARRVKRVMEMTADYYRRPCPERLKKT